MIDEKKIKSLDRNWNTTTHICRNPRRRKNHGNKMKCLVTFQENIQMSSLKFPVQQTIALRYLPVKVIWSWSHKKNSITVQKWHDIILKKAFANADLSTMIIQGTEIREQWRNSLHEEHQNNTLNSKWITSINICACKVSQNAWDQRKKTEF